MLIDRQKMELNKKDIYENVRRDVMRKQTLHSSKNISGSNPVDTNTKNTRRRVARKHFSSRRKSECELSVKCAV